jgi:hypothetical protein
MEQQNQTMHMSWRVPNPEAGSAYNHGWKVLMKYFLEILLIIVVSSIISSPFFLIDDYDEQINDQSGYIWEDDNVTHKFYYHTPFDDDWSGPTGFFMFLYGILIAGPIQFGVFYACYKAVKDKKPLIQYLFDPFKNYWNVILANLLMTVIIGLGFALLIIPGIIFACRLAFVPYLVVDKKMEAVDAVKESWRMTKPYAWTIFATGLLTIPVFIIGFIALIIGVLVSIMLINLAFATLYYAVEEREKRHIHEMRSVVN